MINSLSNIPIQTKAYQHKNNNLPIKNVAGFDEFVLQDKIPVTYKGGRAFLETSIQQIPDKNTKENWLNMVLDGADNCVKNMVDKNKS